MSVLLQISDTHFGTERAPVVEALVAFATQQRPDVVVLSGDITQRASRAQFRVARAFVDRLPAPVLTIPGNHDVPLFNVPARLMHPYGHYREAFGDDLEPVHASADLLVACLNTTRWWRHKNGEISADQVERVAARVASAAPGQLRVIVVHQPVAVPQAGEVHNLVRRHALAVHRWAEAGADLVLGGHIHLPYAMPLPELSRPLWVVQAGTAVSHRVRGEQPNSVNLLRWGHDAPLGQCVIERWDCPAAGPAFERAAVTRFEPLRVAP
jgi:3',5'-cyclic AMP phosphodiesterase CpdA